MDIFAGFVFVLVGAAFVAFLVSPGTARSLDGFAAWFLPYKGIGWPQGVQEQDPIPWNFRSGDHADVSGGVSESNPDSGPELVEISSAGAPAATAVDPGRLVRGTTTRRILR